MIGLGTCRRWSICALGLILVCGGVRPLPAQRALFHRYGAADGLQNLNVRCLLQDRTGYIWVGTDNGLFRYDGSRFTSFGHSEGLPSTEILNLAESPDGVLWAATQGGLARLSGSGFESVDIGQQGSIIGLGFDRTGRLYIESLSGIVRGLRQQDGTYQFTAVVPGDVRGMFVGGSEIIYERDEKLWRLTDAGSSEFGRGAGLPRDHWEAIERDSLGNLWVRSRTSLYELPKGDHRFKNRSDGVPHAAECYLYTDLRGRVFVASNAGMVVLDGHHRAIIDRRHGLLAESVGPSLVDHEQSLWIGAIGAGLVRELGHGEWTSWTTEDGLLHGSVWAMDTDADHRIWVGTDGGLSILKPEGGALHQWTSRNGLAGDRVLDIVAGTNNDYWVGTDPAGISHFNRDGQLLHTYTARSGYTAEQVYRLAVDPQGRLWAMGRGGCFRSRQPLAKQPNPSFEQMMIPGMPPRAAYRDVLVDDSGILWIASSFGLLRYDGHSWKTFSKQDGLVAEDLAAIGQGLGSLWVSYRDAYGITRLQVQGDRVIHPQHLTMSDGLASDEVYAFGFDSRHRMWLNTDRGMSVLENGHWRHYGSEDGLVWDDTDSLALTVDRNGSVLIGTSGGMSRYAALSLEAPDAAPPVVLTAIQTGTKIWEAADHPILPYSQRSISFECAALTYGSPGEVRFRYRLSGYDSAWTETSERSIHFAALPAGRYRFEVIARGSNGLWSPLPASFAFSVRGPWWASWWFICSCCGAAVLVIRALMRLRVRVLISQKEILQRQVDERTAELIESHRQMEEYAYFDMLTSLPNRRKFAQDFQDRLAVPFAAREPFALLLIDLNLFKSINDTFGHDAGDEVLIQTAIRLRSVLRESDQLARLGGDEFGILLSSPDSESVNSVCARIIDSFRDPIVYRDTDLAVTCSIGYSTFPHDGDSQDSLYKRADVSLYKNKSATRIDLALEGQVRESENPKA